MNVTSSTQTSGSTTLTTATTATGKATLDYNNFLQLLIAEMKNQDPSEPMKSSDYMAQFASFSNVEQAIQTNTKLDSLLTATALSQADSALGHTVTSADGTVSGKIMALRIASGGLIATLDSGKELTLGDGVTVS